MKRKLPLLLTPITVLMFSLILVATSFAQQEDYASDIIVALSDTSMTLENGTSCAINDLTIIENQLDLGMYVQAYSQTAQDGSCFYTAISTTSDEVTQEIFDTVDVTVKESSVSTNTTSVEDIEFEPMPELEPIETVMPDYEFVRKSGSVANADETSVTIKSLTCEITGETVIRGDIVEGVEAKLLGKVDGKERCEALILYVRNSVDDLLPEFDHTARVKRLSETSIKVGRLTFTIDANTQITDTLELRDKVYVQATKVERGEFRANIVTLVKRSSPVVEPNTEMVVMGFASGVTDTSVVVENVTYQINEGTQVVGELVDGAKVSVTAFMAEDASHVATKVQVFEPRVEKESPTFLRGEASDVSTTSVTIGEQVVMITADTKIKGELTDGAKIFIRAEADESGTLTAMSIYVKRNASTLENATKSIAGKVKSLTDTELKVRRRTYVITENSQLPEGLAVGDRIRLTAQLTDDETYEILLVESLNAILGKVESISDTGIRVNSIWYQFDESADIDGDITVGDTVTISTEVDETVAPLSPMMRAASAQAAPQTALLISPTVLAPTSVGLANSGAGDGLGLIPLIFTILLGVIVLAGGLSIWTKRR